MPEKLRNIAAYIIRDPETGFYIGLIPGMPGAHTQGETLDELHKNLKEVVELCLPLLPPEEKQYFPEFVGIQQVEVTI